MFGAIIFGYPISYRAQYETAVQKTENPTEAKMDISSFNGNLLVFAGDDDAMWHSEIMAQEIYDNKSENTELVIYKNVGHLLEPITYAKGLAFGGNNKDNGNAKTDSTTKLINFLEKYHK